HQAMLVAELLLLLGIAETGLGGRVGIGDCFLAYASATHEDLRLKQFLALARLALHVVDGVAVLHIRVKSKDHENPEILFSWINKYAAGSLDTRAHLHLI